VPLHSGLASKRAAEDDRLVGRLNREESHVRRGLHIDAIGEEEVAVFINAANPVKMVGGCTSRPVHVEFSS
jgi:hypothetical protein